MHIRDVQNDCDDDIFFADLYHFIYGIVQFITEVFNA